MSDVRVTYGRRSRVSGTQVGVQVNTFGMQKLIAGVNGEALAEIMMEAAAPAKDEAVNNWAVLTGASQASIELAVAEIGPTSARIVLQAGGEKLITDSRNKSGKDYAPFLEFNGSPSGSQPPGVLAAAIYGNDTIIRRGIHDGVRALIAELSHE